jgi:hypothetical protein
MERPLSASALTLRLLHFLVLYPFSKVTLPEGRMGNVWGNSSTKDVSKELIAPIFRIEE